MESGQMLMTAQIQPGGGSPATRTPSSPAAASPAGDQAGSVFAGILGGKSAPGSRNPVSCAGTAKSGSQVVAGTSGKAAVPEQAGAKADVIAALLAELGSQSPVTPLGLNEASVKPETESSTTEQSVGLTPQEVALSGAGAQIILAAQLNGRMPEAVQQSGQPDESAVGPVNGKALQNSATASPVQGLAGAALMQATAGSVLNPESTPKSGVVAASTATSKNDALLKIVVPEGGASTSSIRPESVVDGKQQDLSESLSVNRQGSDSAKPAEEVPVSQAPASPAKSVTVMKDALSLQTARQPETRPALADAAVSTVIAASPQEQADTSVLARTVHAPQAVHPNPGVSAQEAGIKRPDNQEDGTRQRLDTGAIKKSLLNEVAEFPKVVASSAVEKEFANDGDKGTSDHFMNGQSSLTATHLQLKPESGITSATASVAGQGEAVRSDVSENVVRQVREVFANRDIKQGSEQITLKLTPENLGELTVNLKMENQQLRIEIVAENRSVKDALLQNTETLKDSLSRQNITMESFDVTTGGGQQGFAQGDKGWRQLAQQQLAAWAPTGGYRTAAREVSAEIMPRYNTQSQYTMLDVHF